MSNVNTSPNMNLPVPVPTVDPGPDWAQQLYNCLYSIVDQHNHTSGNGVPITPAGLSISSDLSFLVNNAIGLKSARFVSQVAPLAGTLDLGCLYVSGADLFYNDTAGNQVQITMGGTVNATSSGISSGSATASFVGPVLVVNENVNTPANVQAGSVLIGNNVASSNFVTLSPPNSLASSYPIVFPASLPGSRSFVTLDSSGNVASGVAYANGLTSSQIAVGGIATASLADGSVTKPKLAALATAQSGQTSQVTITSNSFTYCNVNLNLTCSGRPVMLILTSDNGGLNGSSYILTDITNGAAAPAPQEYEIVIAENGTNIALWDFGSTHFAVPSPVVFPVSFTYLRISPPAGVNSYSVYARCKGTFSTMTVNGIQLFAYEPG